MKAFSFSSILKNFGKQLSSLASQMPWCNLRFNLGSISVLSRVSRPFSRTSLGTSFGTSLGASFGTSLGASFGTSFGTSFGASRRASHFAAILTILFTIGVGSVWGDEFTYPLTSATSTSYSDDVVYCYGNDNSTTTTSVTGTQYVWNEIQSEKFKNNIAWIEVPSANAQGVITFVCSGSNTSRWLYIYDNTDAQDANRKMPYCGSNKIVGVVYTSSDIHENEKDGKYYLKFGTSDDFKIKIPITLYVSLPAGNTHSLTVTSTDENKGTAAAAASSVAEGATTTITATPNSGYQFDHWTVSGTGATLSSTTTNPTTLTMGTSDVTVTAYFVEKTCPSSGTLYSAVAAATGSISIAGNTSDLELNTSTHKTTVTGGSMYVTSQQTDSKNLITDNGFTMTNNNTFFKIVLDCELAAGDIISIAVGKDGSNARGVWVSSASSRPGSAPACALTATNASLIPVTYTVTENDEYNGKKVLYIYRATTNTTYFNNINISRSDAASCTAPTITFSNGSYTVGGSALNLSTLFTSNSAGAVTYTITNANGTGATIDGTSFTATAAGTATVKATQAANGDYCSGETTATITVNAAQEPETYSITYNLGPEGWKDGYTPASTYTAGEEYTLPTSDNLTNENYGTFQGWYENNTFTGEAVTSIPTNATGDKTYYAKWVYDIKFFEVVDEATDVENKEFNKPLTGASYPTTYTYGVGITLPELPAKDGYTADGWYSQWCVYYQETNGLGWVDACKLTALDNNAYGNINFAVKYTANTYTLTWDANGGNALTGDYTIGSVAYGTTIIKPSDPTREGYTFAGWSPEVAATMPAANTTYTAQWTAKTTTITINANTANHGNTTPGNVTATYGSALPSFTAAAGESGYSLTGYFTAATGGTKIINADGTLVASTDYADGSGKWKSEDATLTLFAQYEEEAPAPAGDCGEIIKSTFGGTKNTSSTPSTTTFNTTGEIGGTSTSAIIGSEGKLNGEGAYLMLELSTGTFLKGDTIKISSDKSGGVKFATGTPESYTLIGTASTATSGGQPYYFVLAANADNIIIPRGASGSDYNQNPEITYVSVHRPCPECDATPSAPTAFSAGSITSTGATFSITDAANAASYDIYYSTSNSAPTASTAATTTSTEKTKEVTGLTASTTYYAWVRSVCDADHKSDWVALDGSSFTTTSAPAELTAIEANVLYQPLNMLCTGMSPLPSGDTYFTDDAYSTDNRFYYDVSSGNGPKAHTISEVTLGSGQAYEATFTSEMWVKGTSTVTDGIPSAPSIKFLTPSTSGTLYLYIESSSCPVKFKKEDGTASNITSLTQVVSGKIYSTTVEANSVYYIYGNGGSNTGVYGLKLITCTTPAAPTAFSNTAVTSTTATFSITDAGDAASYEIYTSTSSSTPTSETGTSVNSKTPTITGLTASTTYYAWVRSVCDDTHKSDWVALGTTSFTTAAAAALNDGCWDPANTAADKLTSGDVSLTTFENNFSDVEGITSVTIQSKGTSDGQCSGADEGTPSGYMKVKNASSSGVKIITIVTSTAKDITIGGEPYGSNTGSFYLVKSTAEIKLAECNTGATDKATNCPAGTYYVYAKGNSSKSINFSLLCIEDAAPDETAPTFVSSVPANGATGVATSGTIVLTFNEPLGSVDASKFTLTGATKGTVTIDGSDAAKVNITYTGAENSSTVTLATAAAAVSDVAGNALAAALSNISFTTAADDPEPEPGTETCITLGSDNSKDIKSDGTATVGNYTIAADEVNWQSTSAKIDNDNDYIIITNSTGITAANVTAKSNILFVTYSSSIDGTESKTTEEVTATNDFTKHTLNVPNGTKYIKLQRKNGGSSIYVSEICLTEGAALPSCTTPILSNLENEKVCPGEDVSWTASITNSLATGELVSYKWTKKGNATILSPTATLTLNDVTEAAGGTYVVTAIVSAEGKASATATKEVTLTVTPATATLTITANANTIYKGNSVTLTATCASSGVGYQWYTCTDADGTNAQAIGGATNATYTLTAGEAGTYYYKVIVTGDGTHSCGTAEKVYELVVKTPSAGCYDMIIFDSSKDQTIPAVDATGTEENTGASWANIGTATSSGSCTYTYNGKTYKKGWKFVGGTTQASNRYIQFEIPSGYVGSLFMAGYITSTGRSLFISNSPTGSLVTTYAYITPDETNTLNTASAELSAGTYYVCATNAFFLTELSVEVCSDVDCTDPEVIATDNATVCAGAESTVTFTASNAADGASFQWQKKNGNTWTNISETTSDNTYTISPVTTKDAGQYRVIAKKECSRTSEEVTLTVLTPPTFNTFATTASVMKGDALTINDVEATNATDYTWYKSADNSLDVTADTKVGTSKDLLLAAASITEEADQTFYLFCVASNSCGSTPSNAITVTVTPFVEEECATKGNETNDREFGFVKTGASDKTYNEVKAWECDTRNDYLTYTPPSGKLFKTVKVTVAITSGSKCGYAYSTDGGTTLTINALDGLSEAYQEKTIEFVDGIDLFRISRNLQNTAGTDIGGTSGDFYLSKICFTYENTCFKTTTTPSATTATYDVSTGDEFTEPTFTVLSGENTITDAELTYTSSNTNIATVDEDGNVSFEGLTGTVTITASYEENETYCASSGSYTITVTCESEEAPKIVAATGTDLDGCNNSITLEAKKQDGTSSFESGSYQWYYNGEAIEGATSASYEVVRAGTYTVSHTGACVQMSSNSAVVTNENPEPKVERLVPFQYYHKDKTYTAQMKNRHLFAVTSYGSYNGKRYHLTATRNSETLEISDYTAFFVKQNADNTIDSVMVDLNELSGKFIENDEIVITCAAINNCDQISPVTNTITIRVIDQTPTLALICSGHDGDGTRTTKEMTVGGDFLTGYNKADLCKQTGNTTFNPDSVWVFYEALQDSFIVTPVNGYAQFNKLNYEPFDILLLTDYPKSSRSEAAQKIIDDMAALCDYRPLLSFKTHFQSDKWTDDSGEYKYTKWVKKGFTTAPVVPDTTATFVNIVCYAHPMFEDIDDINDQYTFHDDDDPNQLVYEVLTGPGYEGRKGIQGFELADADNFVTIGLVHYNAIAEEVLHDGHTHINWNAEANDRLLVAMAERQTNIEARMMLFSLNCGAQSLQTPGGRNVILQCLKYLLETDPLKVADCRFTFDNGAGNTDFDQENYEGTGTKGDSLWSTAANWGPDYIVVPGRNNDVRIAAPCIVDGVKTKISAGDEVQETIQYYPEVLSIHITEDGSLTIPANSSLTARSTILRADEKGNVYPTNVADISLGSNADGNASLILNNERGDTKAGVAMYSTAKADMENMSAATSTWQYIGTPHTDVQNATYNYYDSWLYQYDTNTQGWVVIPKGGPLVPFRGYCITHPESPHTYWMEGTLAATTNQDITIPKGKFVVVANSWTAPIQINELTDDDMEGLKEKSIYFFNTGSDPEGDNSLTADATGDARWAPSTYISVPIHAADYTDKDANIPSMQGFYVVGGDEADGTLHLDYERHVRAKRENVPSGPMHAPARITDTDNEPQVAKFLFRGTRYDDRLIILERPDFTRGYDSGWDGEQWGGNAAAPMSYVVAETRYDAVSAIPEYEGTVIGFRAGEDNIYTIHFEYDAMAEPLYLLDTYTQIYTRILKGNTYTFACPDKGEHKRFVLTRKAPQITTGTENSIMGENAKAVKFIKDDKIFIFVNGVLYDTTGKMVVR